MTTTVERYKWQWCLIVFVGLTFTANAQSRDTLVFKGDTTLIQGVEIDMTATKEHSPHKASFYAAILPGLGQAYNKKYWKIPLLYGGIGGVGYAIHFNSKYYNKYKAAYRDFIIRDPGNKSYREFIPPGLDEQKIYGQYEQWFEEALNNKKQYYRRYRDLSYIGMIGVYVIQIVDAAVDAHFYNFDISDDLSMLVAPAVMPPVPGDYSGMGVQLKFKF